MTDPITKENLLAPDTLDRTPSGPVADIKDLPIGQSDSWPAVHNYLTNKDDSKDAIGAYQVVVQDVEGEASDIFYALPLGKNYKYDLSGYDSFLSSTQWARILAKKGDGRSLKYRINRGEGVPPAHVELKAYRSKSPNAQGEYQVFLAEENKMLDPQKCQGILNRRPGSIPLMSGYEVMELAFKHRLSVGAAYCVEQTGDDLYQFLVNATDYGFVERLARAVAGDAFALGHVYDEEGHLTVWGSNPVAVGLLETVREELENSERALISIRKTIEGLEKTADGLLWTKIGIGLGMASLYVSWRIAKYSIQQSMQLMREQMQGPKINFEQAVTDMTKSLKEAVFEVNDIGERYSKAFEEALPKPDLNAHISRNGPTGASKGFSIDYFFTKLLQGLVSGWEQTPVTVWSVSGNSFKSTAGAFVNNESRLLNEIMEKAVAKVNETKGEVFIVLREGDALLGDGHGRPPNADFFKALLTFMEAKENPAWKKVHWVIDTSRPQAILDIIPDLARRVTFIESDPPKVTAIQTVLDYAYRGLQKEYPEIKVTQEALEAIAYLGENPTRGASPSAQIKLLEELMKKAFVESRRLKQNILVTEIQVFERVARDFGTTREGAQNLLMERKADPSRVNGAIEKAFYSKYNPVTGTAQGDDPEVAAIRRQLEELAEAERREVARASAHHWLQQEMHGKGPTPDQLKTLAERVALLWEQIPEQVKTVYRQAGGEALQQLAQSNHVTQETIAGLIPREFVKFWLLGPTRAQLMVTLQSIYPKVDPKDLEPRVSEFLEAWRKSSPGELAGYQPKFVKGGVPGGFVEKKVEEWKRDPKLPDFKDPKPMLDWPWLRAGRI